MGGIMATVEGEDEQKVAQLCLRQNRDKPVVSMLIPWSVFRINMYEY